MKDETLLPKIFPYCTKYNTSACPESENIQKDFSSRIEPLEINTGDNIPDTGEVGKIITEISKKYCQGCFNFERKLS